MTLYDQYETPLKLRYSSKEMLHIFSPQNKYSVWRTLWTELAATQKKAGLDISESQIKKLKECQHTIDFDRVAQHEKETQHEVMAHILAYGEDAPDAKGIIHLGCTSSFVMDNGDLIQIKQGLELIGKNLKKLLLTFNQFCETNKSKPCIGFTHFQPAQPTTVGKRASLWLQDLLEDFKSINSITTALPFLGLKGATGSQQSFLELFDGDTQKIDQIEKEVASSFGFKIIQPLASQTYSRKLDITILNAFESLAATLHKMATDIRLLSHLGEINEQFGEKQVGSSAMPHKKNPIYSERICSLARLVISLAQNASYTHSTQWLERSLDDSANRRISIAESFLLVDAILTLSNKVISNLQVNEEVIQNNLKKQLPVLCLEPLLMIATKKGGDRQTLHEKLKNYAHFHPDNFHQVILEDSTISITKEELEKVMDPNYLIGRCPDQVTDFLNRFVKPALQTHP